MKMLMVLLLSLVFVLGGCSTQAPQSAPVPQSQSAPQSAPVPESTVSAPQSTPASEPPASETPPPFDETHFTEFFRRWGYDQWLLEGYDGPGDLLQKSGNFHPWSVVSWRVLMYNNENDVQMQRDEFGMAVMDTGQLMDAAREAFGEVPNEFADYFYTKNGNIYAAELQWARYQTEFVSIDYSGDMIEAVVEIVDSEGTEPTRTLRYTFQNLPQQQYFPYMLGKIAPV